MVLSMLKMHYQVSTDRLEESISVYYENKTYTLKSKGTPMSNMVTPNNPKLWLPKTKVKPSVTSVKSAENNLQEIAANNDLPQDIVSVISSDDLPPPVTNERPVDTLFAGLEIPDDDIDDIILDLNDAPPNLENINTQKMQYQMMMRLMLPSLWKVVIHQTKYLLIF